MSHFMRAIVQVVVLAVCLTPSVLLAQAVDTDTFSVRIYGGNDTTPPSTPMLLSATPVASTQIDVTWTAATDDYAVAGYSVLRDGTPIATTSLLSYADTSLSASTTYSYSVRAFDYFANYSSTSNSIATTTPAVVVPPTPEPEPEEGGGVVDGTIARVVVKDFSILTGVATTSLHLTTAQPARIEVRWGRTTSYELGYLVSSVFTREHQIQLTDLEPGTTYEYEIVGYTPSGRQTALRSGSFTTLEKTEGALVPNVSQFSADVSGNDVLLSWQLPAVSELGYVRVLRSHLGFPLHPQDGAVVYQGLRENVRDPGILRQYSPVYYTIFVFDVDGNVSSGALAVVYAPSEEGGSSDTVALTEPPLGAVVPGLPEMVSEATSSIDVSLVTAEMKMPDLSDLVLRQGERFFTFIDTNIALSAEHATVVSVPVEAVAGNLKSIIATVVNPTDHRDTDSYLLRINKTRTAYEAVVPAFGVLGSTQFSVAIYDYQALVVAKYQTPVQLVDVAAASIVFPDQLIASGYMLPAMFLLLILLIFGLFFMVAHKRQTTG